MLTMLRRSETRLMIDATFTCVPKGFSQCIVVMMFDEETDLFIPVVYALTDTKAQWSYWHLLHFLIVLTDLKMEPNTVTTDFEAPLFKAVGEQFPNARRIGCKFHFKQALRRKLINLDFAADDVQRLMRPGCLDRIRETEKVSIGETLNALRHENEIEDDEKWKSLCDYFSHTWIRG